MRSFSGRSRTIARIAASRCAFSTRSCRSSGAHRASAGASSRHSLGAMACRRARFRASLFHRRYASEKNSARAGWMPSPAQCAPPAPGERPAGRGRPRPPGPRRACGRTETRPRRTRRCSARSPLLPPAHLLAPSTLYSPHRALRFIFFAENVCGRKKRALPFGGALLRRRVYLANSVARVSRMTLTLIWPGYSSSFSMRLTISLAMSTESASLTCSGLTMMRTSRPAWIA